MTSRNRGVFTARFFAVAFLVVALPAASSRAYASPAGGIATAGAFVDSIGVDTHFNYLDTPYGSAYAQERKMLLALGVRHIRDGSPTTSSTYQQRLRDLCDNGIKHSVGFPVNTTAERIGATLLEFDPACIDFVEPSNEFDSAGRGGKIPDWPTQIVAEQRLLFTTVRADARFSKIVVLGPALADSSQYATLGDIEAYVDAGNNHFSTCDDSPEPTHYHHLGMDQIRNAVPNKPVWTTETQYSDNASRRCYLPDDVIAKYVPRTIAERFEIGEPRTYWYEFSDQPSDTVFGREGFVDENGRPKPQYFALHSLISELADPGDAFTAKPLAYAIENASPKVAHALLARRDGTYDLLLWLEVPSWNGRTGAALTNSPERVTVTLPPSVSRATLATYDSHWKYDRARVAIAGGRASVPVTDSIEVLELGR